MMRSRFKPSWRIVRAYAKYEDAERNLKKREREGCYKYSRYRIAKAGKKPRDKWDENWE